MIRPAFRRCDSLGSHDHRPELCGGQIITGIAATVSAWLVLSPLKRFHSQVTQTHKASIKIVTSVRGSMPDPTIRLQQFAAKALFTGASYLVEGRKDLSFELRWLAKGGDGTAADVYDKLLEHFDLTLFKLHTTTSTFSLIAGKMLYRQPFLRS